MIPVPQLDRATRVSVVVPVYRSAPTLAILCTRLRATLQPLFDHYEILLVDDRSPDQAWEAILGLQRDYPEVKGVRLSRNFGQQIAISAGLAETRGSYAVVMDGDLSDPPEKIPEMFAKIAEGYDLVMARRFRRSHSWFRIWAAKLYFVILSRLSEEEIDGSYGSFTLLSRKVINGYLQFTERERHYLFILRWMGFRVGTIEYEHLKRTIGRSSYSIVRLFRHAIDGFLFQTTVFLRWIVSLGLLFALGGMALALYFAYQYVVRGTTVPGWTSVIVVILFSTGIILVSVGIIGLYIGKVFDQTKGRPLYVIDAISEASSPW